MSWGRLDDSFYDHPKLDALGSVRLPCVGLHTLALSWSNRFLTDGFIPAARVQRLGGTTGLADRLVAAGLWERAGDDYRIHDFLDFNPSAADVRSRRRHMSEIGKRGGLASGEARRLTPRSSVDEPRPVPSQPIPILGSQKRPEPRYEATQRLIREQEERKARILEGERLPGESA